MSCILFHTSNKKVVGIIPNKSVHNPYIRSIDLKSVFARHLGMH